MATRRFSIHPSDTEFQVTEAVGAATATKSIELTVDLANVLEGNTKPISKVQVLLALEKLHNYVLKSNWPPA